MNTNKHIPKKTEKVLDNSNTSSLILALNYLNTQGFKTQFKVNEQALFSTTTQKKYTSDEVIVVHIYRFEGESDPDDNEIIFAIITKDGEKGTLVDAYGLYNDANISNFMKSVKIDASVATLSN